MMTSCMFRYVITLAVHIVKFTKDPFCSWLCSLVEVCDNMLSNVIHNSTNMEDLIYMHREREREREERKIDRRERDR